jgi:hypothetical protein
MTNSRTAATASVSSQAAWLSSRCIRSGVRSPACSASVHPFLRGRSASSPAKYLPACRHTSRRANATAIRPNSSASFPDASRPASIIDMAAASYVFVCVTTANDHEAAVLMRRFDTSTQPSLQTFYS